MSDEDIQKLNQRLTAVENERQFAEAERSYSQADVNRRVAQAKRRAAEDAGTLAEQPSTSGGIDYDKLAEAMARRAPQQDAAKSGAAAPRAPSTPNNPWDGGNGFVNIYSPGSVPEAAIEAMTVSQAKEIHERNLRIIHQESGRPTRPGHPKLVEK